MSQRPGSRRRKGDEGRTDRLVVGLHPVREVLRAGQPLRRVVVDRARRDDEVVDEILRLAGGAGVAVDLVDRAEVDDQAAGLVHQGVLAIGPPFTYAELSDVLSRRTRDEPPLLVALDGVTDPHNVGSIARTAEAVGADALLIPSRRAAAVTPTVEKAAAGALAHLPVVRVPNLVRALEQAKDAGCWIVGLDADGDTALSDCGLLVEPLVLVVGSEGRGLARLTQVTCQILVGLPMRGRVSSLNASVAASVALYEALRQRSLELNDQR